MYSESTCNVPFCTYILLRHLLLFCSYGFNLLENASTLPEESPKKLAQSLQQLLQCSECASSTESSAAESSESSCIRRRFVRAAHLWAQEQMLHTLRRPEEVARLPDQYSPELFAAVVRASAQPSDWEVCLESVFRCVCVCVCGRGLNSLYLSGLNTKLIDKQRISRLIMSKRKKEFY